MDINNTEINEIRKQIDLVDTEMLALFTKRMELSAQVAAAKAQQGQPLLNMAREEEILARISNLTGPELSPYTRELFSTLFDLSKVYQARLKAASRPPAQQLFQEAENIVLIGMPGCGKSTVGAALAQLSGRLFLDIDDMVLELAGQSIPQIFACQGEEAFREWERQAVAIAAAYRGSVIATGGGSVLLPENCRALRQNGSFFLLQRPLSQLQTAGRPLSQDLSALYAQRMPIYLSLAQAKVDNDSTILTAAQNLWAAYEKLRESL